MSSDDEEVKSLDSKVFLHSHYFIVHLKMQNLSKMKLRQYIENFRESQEH